MGFDVRTTCAIAVLFSVFLPAAAWCQTSTFSAATASPAATATPTPPQAGGPAPQPAPTGFLEQQELTGNWGGARTRWRDKGLVLDTSFTQFYQGIAAGGRDEGSEYNATAQAKAEFDFGKLAGWQFWSAEIKGEWRFGGPLLTGTG